MYNLGVLAKEEGDRGAARGWCVRAADAGHAGAMNILGVLAYEEGDRGAARDWYVRAADAGNADAMHNLGVLAAHGW